LQAERSTAISLLTGQAALTPGASVESKANFLWASASSAITPDVGIVSVANRIADALAALNPEVDIEAIGARLTKSGIDITVTAGLVEIASVIRDGQADITPAAAVASAAIALFSGQVAITPEIGAVLSAYKLASAVAALTPDADVEPRANYITCATAAIALAVSVSALSTRVIDGGTVSIEISASVSAIAAKYLVTVLGLSGDLAPGSVLEINSDYMTFKIDGVNALKDMVGDFPDVDAGDSTVTYEDDEGTRDVTLDLKYTPRDA